MRVQLTTRNGRRFARTLLLFFGAWQAAWAQSPQISGTVQDMAGLPLPGVTVILMGTTTGTATAADGSFTLTTSRELTG